MDWSSLIPGRNLTNADLVKELIQEKRVQHPRAVQALLKVALFMQTFPNPPDLCMQAGLFPVTLLLDSRHVSGLQVDRKFFICPDMHETDAYQVSPPT